MRAHDFEQLRHSMERIEMLLIIQSKDMLTAEEAAFMLGISPGHIGRLARERKLPYYRHGRNIYFSKKEIEAAMLTERYPSEREIIEAQRKGRR